MLKRHFALVNFMRISLDVLAIGILWNAVYYLFSYFGFYDQPDIPSASKHWLLSIPAAIILYLCRHWMGVYKSLRIQPTFTQFGRQIESILLGWMFVVLFLYYTGETAYTRFFLILFLFALLGGLLVSHSLLLQILHWIRSRGYNQRHYAIIGTGKNAVKLLRDIEKTSSFGLKCRFFIDNKPHLGGKTIADIPVYGELQQLPELA
ncbi:MAG: nucleoside-diphosphate sugar epimerase/dehydratase, partial [Planctomycetota bacterium]